MTAFTADQRVKLRKYLGMNFLWSGINPILESSLDAIEDLPDGGATQADIVVTVNQIMVIEAEIAKKQLLTLGTEIEGEIKYDAGRSLQILRREGTNMIGALAINTGFAPFKRYFYSRAVDDSRDYHLHG